LVAAKTFSSVMVLSIRAHTMLAALSPSVIPDRLRHPDGDDPVAAKAFRPSNGTALGTLGQNQISAHMESKHKHIRLSSEHPEAISPSPLGCQQKHHYYHRHHCPLPRPSRPGRPLFRTTTTVLPTATLTSTSRAVASDSQILRFSFVQNVEAAGQPKKNTTEHSEIIRKKIGKFDIGLQTSQQKKKQNLFKVCNHHV